MDKHGFIITSKTTFSSFTDKILSVITYNKVLQTVIININLISYVRNGKCFQIS